MNEELKYCKFCNKQKPKKDFCKSGGFTKNICRECHNKKQKERYANSKLVEEKDKEIERLNKGLEYMKLYWSNREEYEKNELLNQIRDKDTSIEWLERAIEEEKKRERLH